jgi:hypothetical protein
MPLAPRVHRHTSAERSPLPGIQLSILSASLLILVVARKANSKSNGSWNRNNAHNTGGNGSWACGTMSYVPFQIKLRFLERTAWCRLMYDSWHRYNGRLRRSFCRSGRNRLFPAFTPPYFLQLHTGPNKTGSSISILDRVGTKYKSILTDFTK